MDSSILSGKKKPSKKTAVVNLGSKGSFKIRKGALHRKLGIAEGTKIPEARLNAALHSKDPETRRMAASAKGLKAMHHGS
jgi:hypothetical protein